MDWLTYLDAINGLNKYRKIEDESMLYVKDLIAVCMPILSTCLESI